MRSAQKSKARKARKLPGSRQTVTSQYERDPWVTEYALREANEICYLCEQPSPFLSKKGEQYLKAHQFVWQSQGGGDSVNSVVALCPSCHRKMHILGDQKDVAFLLAKKAGLEI